MIFELWYNVEEFSYTLLGTREESDDKAFYDSQVIGSEKVHEFEAEDLNVAIIKRNEFLGWK